jgi:hypothetical protein
MKNMHGIPIMLNVLIMGQSVDAKQSLSVKSATN